MDTIHKLFRGMAIAVLNMTGGIVIKPGELAQLGGQPVAAKAIGGKGSNGEPAHMPALPASNGRAGGKVYKVKPGFDTALAKALKGSNARAFSAVLAASKGGKKAAGISAREVAAKGKINPKTTESCLYQLRTMQLVESHDAAAQ